MQEQDQQINLIITTRDNFFGEPNGSKTAKIQNVKALLPQFEAVTV